MARDMGLLMDKCIHYFVLIFTMALISFGLLFAYSAIVKTNDNMIKDENIIEDNKDKHGVAKQLPDFIVDKMKPDELGQLKP